jgi:hypothetical protein
VDFFHGLKEVDVDRIKVKVQGKKIEIIKEILKNMLKLPRDVSNPTKVEVTKVDLHMVWRVSKASREGRLVNNKLQKKKSSSFKLSKLIILSILTRECVFFDQKLIA